MNYFHTKLLSLILDRIIMLAPTEIISIIDFKPSFLEGKTIGQATDWTTKDLEYFSSIFWDDSYKRKVVEGFRGVGIRRGDTPEDFEILLYAEGESFKIIESKLDFLRLKPKSILNQKAQIIAIEVEKAEFASSNICLGGSKICSPISKVSGVLGGWFKRNNPRDIPVGITNNHVAAEYNSSSLGTIICDSRSKPIGEIEGFVPLKNYSTTGQFNLVDLSWLKPANNCQISCALGCLNTPRIPKGEFDFDDYFYNSNKTAVVLCNSVNRYKPGNIIGERQTFYMGHDPHKYAFEDVWQITVGTKGDSGSLILDKDDNVGGLFFAVETVYIKKTPHDPAVKKVVGMANKWGQVRLESTIDFRY